MKNTRLLAILAAVALLAGCLAASPSGQQEGLQVSPPPARPGGPRTIADLPWRELWQVVTFDGQSIGYSHLRLEPLEGGLFRVRSEVVLRLSYLGGAKEVVVRCNDTVGADFSLRRLDQAALIDGSPIRVAGEVRGQALHLEIAQAGRTIRDQLPLSGPIYPSSAINLVAWLRGLGVGGSHHFRVFELQERRLIECRQRVTALERGGEGLCEAEALRIETEYAGIKSTAWVSPEGEPLVERAMGVLITRKADEAAARAALAEAGAGSGSLLDYTIVRTEPIPCRQIGRLRVEFEGLPADYEPLSDSRQAAEARPPGGGRQIVVFSVESRAPLQADPGDLSPYLAASPYVESDDEEVVGIARQIVGRTAGREAVERVVRWVHATLEPTVKDRVSALDALRTGEGDCQAHAYLCAALLRAAAVPCRIVSGLCYSPEEGGFLYHTWCEAYCGGWLAVDPVTGGLADAGHIKLVEGEDIESWAPLAEIVGRIRARVLEWRCAEGDGP